MDLDENNLYVQVMTQKCPVGRFELVENTSDFTRDFVKKYSDEIDVVYFLEANFNISKI